MSKKNRTAKKNIPPKEKNLLKEQNVNTITTENSRINEKQYRTNVIATFITVGLFIITIYQSYLTRNSVIAAIEAVDLSKKQFEIQNQPLLVIDPNSGKINFMPNGQIIMTYMVSNVGAFPTRIIKDKPILIVCDSRLPKEELINLLESEFQKNKEYEKDILVSNNSILLTSTSNFIEDESLIKEGKRIVIFGGELTYEDRITRKRFKLKYAYILLGVNWPDEIIADGIYYSTTEII